MKALAELQRRRVEGGVRYFLPANEAQAAVLADPGNLLVLGGNRSGKTVCGAVETVCRHLGAHPYKTVRKPPIKSWACSQVLPGNTDRPHVQLEELRRWIPREALRGGTWEKAYSPGARTLHWANGGITEFKGYDQGLLSFESAKVHWVWFDEEPTQKEIWTSCLMRLVDYSGKWMMTLTPVLSLQGKGWVEDGLYNPWMEANGEGLNYTVHHVSTYANPHLSREMVDEVVGNLSEEEKAVRADGKFARIGGRVLSELRDIHIVQPFLPPRSWRHYLIIDPGYRNATAAIFAAADPDGALYIYAEHYVKEQLPPFHMEVLDGFYRGFKLQKVDSLMDPASWARVGTVLGRSNKTVYEEYMKAALEHKASWFHPRPAQNEERGVWRMKRYLMPNVRPDGQEVPLLYICSNCHWWQWEAERWTWPGDRSGRVANEKAVAEKPIEKDNHLMDCTKYLVNEMPDVEDRIAPPKPRTTEEIVANHLKRIVRRNEKLKKGKC